MASIDLPRPLQDYFAFAETTPTREGRRFSITFPYLRADGRIDRLQWWYHLSDGREKVLGEEALRSARAEAIERFTTHIERWAENTGQTLRGEGPIPQLALDGASRVSLPSTAASSVTVEPTGEACSLAEAHAPVEPHSPVEARAQVEGPVPNLAASPEEVSSQSEPSVSVPKGKTAFG